MAVTYDSVGGGTDVSKSALSTWTVTWSHTIASAGVNTCVVLGLSGSLNTGSVTPSDIAATYGGVAMSVLHNSTFDAGHSQFYAVLYLFNPPTGAQTVSATVTFGASRSGWVGGDTVAYQGVDTIITGGTNSGTGTSTTITVTSATDEMVFVNTAAFDTQTSPTQTSRFNAPSNACGLLQDAAGAASVTVGSTVGSTSWLAAAARLQPSTTPANTGGFFGMFL